MSNKSEKIDLLAKALCDAQKEIKRAVKESENPFFKSKYADLGSVYNACLEALNKNGLSVAQPMRVGIDGPEIATLLMHSSGQWIEGVQRIVNKTKLPPEAYALVRDVALSVTDKDGADKWKLSMLSDLLIGDATPQEMGSAITYARRYGLAAMVGVVQADDDGETAMKRPMTQGKPVAAAGPYIPGQGHNQQLSQPNTFARNVVSAVTPNHYDNRDAVPGDLEKINQELLAASNDAVTDIFGAVHEHVDFSHSETPPPFNKNEDVPMHCGQKMVISKYVDKNMGPNAPFWCTKCKHKVAR